MNATENIAALSLISLRLLRKSLTEILSVPCIQSQDSHFLKEYLIISVNRMLHENWQTALPPSSRVIYLYPGKHYSECRQWAF